MTKTEKKPKTRNTILGFEDQDSLFSLIALIKEHGTEDEQMRFAKAQVACSATMAVALSGKCRNCEGNIRQPFGIPTLAITDMGNPGGGIYGGGTGFLGLVSDLGLGSFGASGSGKAGIPMLGIACNSCDGIEFIVLRDPGDDSPGRVATREFLKLHDLAEEIVGPLREREQRRVQAEYDEERRKEHEKREEHRKKAQKKREEAAEIF